MVQNYELSIHLFLGFMQTQTGAGDPPLAEISTCWSTCRLGVFKRILTLVSLFLVEVRRSVNEEISMLPVTISSGG